MRMGIVDLDTSHPQNWIPIERELGHEVVGIWDGGAVHPPEYVQSFAQEHEVPRVYDILEEMVEGFFPLVLIKGFLFKILVVFVIQNIFRHLYKALVAYRKHFKAQEVEDQVLHDHLAGKLWKNRRADRRKVLDKVGVPLDLLDGSSAVGTLHQGDPHHLLNVVWATPGSAWMSLLAAWLFRLGVWLAS